MHNKNERRCIACRQSHDKSVLIRIAKIAGAVDIQSNSASGRGAYICKKTECVEKAIKTKALNRVFKCNVDEAIYEKLRCEVE